MSGFGMGHTQELPWWFRGQSVCLQCGKPGFNPWVGKIPWRRKWQPTPVFLPGKSHGWKNLVRLQSMGLQRVGHDWATSLTHSPMSAIYTVKWFSKPNFNVPPTFPTQRIFLQWLWGRNPRRKTPLVLTALSPGKSIRAARYNSADPDGSPGAQPETGRGQTPACSLLINLWGLAWALLHLEGKALRKVSPLVKSWAFWANVCPKRSLSK